MFLANLRRDPRVGLSIDEDPLPYRKVSVQGEARLVHDLGEDDVWRDLYLEIATRYIPAEQAAAYVQDTIEEPAPCSPSTSRPAGSRPGACPSRTRTRPGSGRARYYRRHRRLKNRPSRRSRQEATWPR